MSHCSPFIIRRSTQEEIREDLPICTSNFYENLESCQKNQLIAMNDIQTSLYGLPGCIFNPRFETSIYDSEDTDYHYPIDPDYEGDLLLTGLANIRRFAGEDQWSAEEVILWWYKPVIFNIREHAKIIINYKDQKLSFRSKNIRYIIGQYEELVQLHYLVPFN